MQWLKLMRVGEMGSKPTTKNGQVQTVCIYVGMYCIYCGLCYSAFGETNRVILSTIICFNIDRRAARGPPLCCNNTVWSGRYNMG